MEDMSNEVIFAKVTFGNEINVSGDAGDSNQMHVIINDDNQGSMGTLQTEETFMLDRSMDNNLWTIKDHALRDLLIFLVKKYHIDEVYDSKVKAKNWDSLINEFHTMTENRVTISKAQIIRKWHNWKQYNKARRKPHPFVVCGNVTLESVVEKCTQLCNQARSDAEFAALLAHGPIEAIDGQSLRKRSGSESDTPIEEIVATKFSNSYMGKLLRRDFIVRKTGANATALALRRLHHDLALENLNFEMEKWRIRLENSRLLNEKLRRQSDIMTIRLQKAQIEVVMKKNQCFNQGIDLV